MRDIKLGSTVRLHTPERGYSVGEVVGEDGHRWIVRFSSGMECSYYSDEFDVEYEPRFEVNYDREED